MMTHEQAKEMACGLLGETAHEFEVQLDGKSWRGWAKMFPSEAAYDLVMPHLLPMHDKGMRIFCCATPLVQFTMNSERDDFAVVMIPDLPPPMIALFCRAGGQSDDDASFLPPLEQLGGPLRELLSMPHIQAHISQKQGDPPERVRRRLAKIEERAPFAVFYGTQCAFELKFLNPVSEETARYIEELVIEIDTDVYQLLEDKELWEVIVADQELKLWWD